MLGWNEVRREGPHLGMHRQSQSPLVYYYDGDDGLQNGPEEGVHTEHQGTQLFRER